MESVGKTLKFAFKVLLLILNVVVAFAALQVASTKFETVVVAGLIIIYATVRTIGVWQHQQSVVSDAAALRRFAVLASALNVTDIGDYHKLARQAQDHVNDLWKLHGFQSSTLAILYVIAVLALLATVL